MLQWPEHTLKSTENIAAGPDETLQELLRAFIDWHQLDTAFAANIPSLYQPMAAWLAQQHDATRPLFVGINGAQGSGKSTLTDLLKLLLEHQHGMNVLSLSIDDLYLSLDERKSMASTIHPLFITRGVPGTHDVSMALQLFEQLSSDTQVRKYEIPRFDKSIDDRKPFEEWHHVRGPFDIVLFEGWCVGARPQAVEQLSKPLNELESTEDSDAIWRRHVNEQLAGEYQRLFNYLDILMMLKVPSMEQVYEWRGLQETRLDESSADDASGIMDNSDLRRFIMHYERLTRSQLEEMPARADVLLPLGTNHQIKEIILN